MVHLTPTIQKFILHWGEMGTRWGVNRTVAQIHALLYISPVPLPAEEIAATLSVARSNVSTSLKELQGWGIVRPVQFMGDRRDHYESLKDVWEMFQVIMDERKKREIDPTLALLRQCVEEAEEGNGEQEYLRVRLKELLAFFEQMSGWYAQIRTMPTAAVRRFVKMGHKVHKLLGAATS